MRTLVVLALCSAALSGCVHSAKPLGPDQLKQLEATHDGYVFGQVGELSDYVLMDNRDFTYSIAFARDSKSVSYSHLAALVYQVGVWSLVPAPMKVTNFPTNPNEFDTESLDFSPDGRIVVTASRDGVVRFFNAKDGTPAGAYPTEEPLVSVAFHPNGRYVVAGSARGLITVIRYPDLAFASEVRAHEGEVRAFAFTDSGVLYSGGWDKSIVPFDAIEEQVPVSQTRMHFDRRGAFATVRAAIDGKASAAFAIDQRASFVLINTKLAQTAGIDVAFLKDTATVPTPMGNQLVKLAKGHTLQFKAMTLRGVDLAICDTCVPSDVQGVLGAPFSDAVDIAFDDAAKEVQLTLKTPTSETAPLLTLKPRTRLTFPWYVNDFSIDRAGKRLGVAFSEVPAQRTREIYEREKKKLVEPTAEGNCAAIVDAQTGAILKKWTKHNGVVSTVGISPDGERLASGGWDKKLFILQEGELNPKIRREFGWSVRRVRFSRDGRFLGLAAWTPQNPLGDQTSDPAAVVYEVLYEKPGFQQNP